MTVYLYPVGDTFSVFYDKSFLPKELHYKLIEFDSLPEGSGILKISGNGNLYYEPFPEDTIINPEPEPEVPVPAVETIEEKLARMEHQFQEQQQQNLILVDINLTVYEELLNMKDQIAHLTGTTDNV